MKTRIAQLVVRVLQWVSVWVFARFGADVSSDQVATWVGPIAAGVTTLILFAIDLLMHSKIVKDQAGKWLSKIGVDIDAVLK